MNCYKITVKTINSMRDTYCVTPDEVSPGEYFVCEDGEVYVIAESAVKTLAFFPDEIIEKIERVGIGRRQGEEEE